MSWMWEGVSQEVNTLLLQDTILSDEFIKYLIIEECPRIVSTKGVSSVKAILKCIKEYKGLHSYG